MAERAIVELGGERRVSVRGPKPDASGPPSRPNPGTAEVTMPRYEVGAKVATRKACGEALAALTWSRWMAR